MTSVTDLATAAYLDSLICRLVPLGAMTDWFESGAMIFHMAQTQAFRDGTEAVPYGLCSVRLLFPTLALSINRRPLSHGLRRASVSLRLGHGAALTCHRHVIHYRAAASLPKRGAKDEVLPRSAAPSRGSGASATKGSPE